MNCEPMLPTLYRVAHKHQESADTVTLELQPEQEPIASVAPGQFNMLYAMGIGEIPVSVGGCLPDEGTLIHTIEGVGKVSQALCRLEPGAQLGVRGPFGRGWPLERLSKKKPLIIAGGLGIAPLRPVIQHLVSDSERFEGARVLYGARTPDDLLYKNELSNWNTALSGGMRTSVDFADASWTGDVGVVLDLISPGDPLDSVVALVCGPEVMMRFAVAELLRRAVSPEDIYVSMERNMKCAIGHCGRCQFVGDFLCKDGPVFSYSHVERFFGRPEL